MKPKAGIISLGTKTLRQARLVDSRCLVPVQEVDMPQKLTCILREEENRWIGRLYESRADDGVVQYTYDVIAPLKFQQGHVVTAELDSSTHKTYRDLGEAQTAMRSALHQRAENGTS